MDCKIVSELCVKRKYTSDSSSTESSEDDDFLESSESDSDSALEERTKRTKIEGFMEKIVPKYSDTEFRSHFRFQRSGVDFVENLVCEEFQKKSGHTGGRENISAKTGTHLFLWYIANQETFRQIADRFNVSERTAHDIIKKVSKKLVDISGQFIVFPQEEEFPALSEGFRRRNNLVGVIGAIDGCHVPIRKPTKNPLDYFCRKKYPSIIIQAVCDHNKKFLDIYVGEPGSLHDARVLRKSPLYKHMVDHPNHLKNYFLLADSAYPLLTWVVPPYKDDGRLTQQQKEFNYLHSSTRVIIENSFGLLRGRFRRLKCFENLSIDLIVQCVIAACVLHNISLQMGDDVEDMDIEEFQDGNNPFSEINDNPGVEENNFPEPTINRRQELLDFLFNNE